MAKEFFIRQGEARTFTVTLKSASGNPIDLTSAACYLALKESRDDTAYVLFKNTQYFDVTSAAVGIVSVVLADSDTWIDPGRYCLELKLSISGQIVKNIDDIFLNIKKSVFERRLVGGAGDIEGASGMTGTVTDAI